RLPDTSTSWPYVTRALICEQQARLDDDRRIALWWEAICYLERAILLDDSDSACWTAMGRLHSLLENDMRSVRQRRGREARSEGSERLRGARHDSRQYRQVR